MGKEKVGEKERAKILGLIRQNIKSVNFYSASLIFNPSKRSYQPKLDNLYEEDSKNSSYKVFQFVL